jgi:hypothetical protein
LFAESFCFSVFLWIFSRHKTAIKRKIPVLIETAIPSIGIMILRVLKFSKRAKMEAGINIATKMTTNITGITQNLRTEVIIGLVGYLCKNNLLFRNIVTGHSCQASEIISA